MADYEMPEEIISRAYNIAVELSGTSGQAGNPGFAGSSGLAGRPYENSGAYNIAIGHQSLHHDEIKWRDTEIYFDGETKTISVPEESLPVKQLSEYDSSRLITLKSFLEWFNEYPEEAYKVDLLSLPLPGTTEINRVPKWPEGRYVK